MSKGKHSERQATASPARDRASEVEPERTPSTLPPPPPAAMRTVVAKGRSVTSLRGILPPGSEVTARDFGDGGEASMDALRAAGIVESAP